MSNEQHQGLPVAGYRPQIAETIALVDANKFAEERILRTLDALAKRDDVDKRWLAVGRTAIENGFMAVNRALFRPDRATLPEDAPVGRRPDPCVPRHDPEAGPATALGGRPHP